MGADSSIEWTDHTFNPWWGCQKVSEGCTNCYALTFAKRYGHDVWGPAKTTERRLFGDKHWSEPLKWNREAEKTGQRKRVFCASMADVFEDHPQVVDARARLFDLISDTPNLDWLLLTKRPENVKPMLIAAGRGFQPLPPWVWIGTSVENQEQADKRIPHLLSIPAHVRFLSCEPLLGAVDLSRWLQQPIVDLEMRGGAPAFRNTPEVYKPIHWVIVGGESGHGARPMHPAWARSLRDQCQSAGVAFHFKQFGEWMPSEDLPDDVGGRGLQFLAPDGQPVTRVGKKAAGRLLDGRTWDEFPT